MFIIGLFLLVFGLLLGIYIMWVAGLVLLILGLVFWFVPMGGRTRRWY
jgi:hypothetical protein